MAATTSARHRLARIVADLETLKTAADALPGADGLLGYLLELALAEARRALMGHVLHGAGEADRPLRMQLHAEAWEAFALMHATIGEALPPGALPSEEEINRRYGPTFAGWAQAFGEAIAAALGRDAR